MGHQADTYLSSGSNVLKVLEYEAGGHFYGINMLKVSRILKEPHGFRTLVNAAPCVRGAFNDHGNIVPLVDLNMFLGGEPTAMEGKVELSSVNFLVS